MSINNYFYSHINPPCKLVLMVIKQLNIDAKNETIDFIKNQQKMDDFLKVNLNFVETF